VAASKTFVALLRAVNVSARNKVPMAELKALVSALGFENPVTYVQSGNVVLDSRAGSAVEVGTTIERGIADAFGLDVAVLVRTPTELRATADGNPFLDREPDWTKLHVVFLDAEPEAAAVARLDPQRSPPDELSVRGQEIYLHLPHGAGRSKLTTDYFERRLGARATARNWNTVMKLLALTER
jgi:uncharacterized protein (DUF1697 family)